MFDPPPDIKMATRLALTEARLDTRHRPLAPWPHRANGYRGFYRNSVMRVKSVSAWAGSTTRTSPMPQLKVFNISVAPNPPVLANRANTGGKSHAPRSTVAPNPSGKNRGRFSVRPPPVICANPRTPPDRVAASAGYTYIRVGTKNASPNVPARHGVALSQSWPLISTSLRTREYPLA